MQNFESRQKATGEIENLQKQLSELQAEAKEHKQLAQQARIKADATDKELELARAQEATVLSAKRKLEELDREIQSSRKKLRID